MGRKKYSYCVEYKSIKNPDKPLDDPNNIRIRSRHFDSYEEAEGWAQSVKNTAGEWDPVIIPLEE